MLIHNEEITISGTDANWSSGSISINSDHKLNGMLMAVYVNPATSTTTYKFRVKDWNDRIKFDTQDYEEGVCNKTNLGIPLKDSFHELNIYSSSAEEDFKIVLAIKE